MHDTVNDDIDDYNSDIEDDIDYHVDGNDIDDDGCDDDMHDTVDNDIDDDNSDIEDDIDYVDDNDIDDDGCDDDIHDEMLQLEFNFHRNARELDFLFLVNTDSWTCLTSLYLYVLHDTTKVPTLRCHYEYLKLLNTARSQHYV